MLPYRIGHGYDLHRLEPLPPAGDGRPLVLAGIRLEHDRGPVSHSDGDAVFHAVTDALLGAVGLPDIGQLFPDNDPRWNGADSELFLAAAHDELAKRGWRVGNVDVTIICERPRIGPRKTEMIANLARVLRCEIGQVNLKGKTHEKVDAVGEGRAVEVHVAALVARDDSAAGAGRTERAASDVGRAAHRDYGAVARSLASSPQGTPEERMRAVVAALWPALRDTGVSWLGFYVDRPDQPEEARLVLDAREPGPACSPIGLHGVCGQSLRGRCVRIVRDVAELGPGYIACDPRDRSEIVLPLIDPDGRCWAVLDLDSHELSAFDERDAEGLSLVLRAAGLTAPARPG
ncbi:MAG: 2-C-methyl-D-erythritol 2,4-cyclodiphosphate synthase [Phycisphaerales bacterium]